MGKYIRMFVAALFGFATMILTIAVCYWLGGDKGIWGTNGFAAAMFLVTYRYVMQALDSTYAKNNTPENLGDFENYCCPVKTF